MGISISGPKVGLGKKPRRPGSGAPLAPQLTVQADMTVPGGYVVGSQAYAYVAQWSGADSTTAYWTLDGVNHVTVAGNNPLTIPNQVGKVLGLKFTATNTTGTREHTVVGLAISAGQTAPASPPSKTSSASISAPNGYSVGQFVTATPSVWTNASTVTDYWKLGTNDTWMSVVGNNPLQVPDNVGTALGIYSVASSDAGQVTDTVSGGTITSGTNYITQTMFSDTPEAWRASNEGIPVSLSLKIIPEQAGQITEVWLNKPSQSTATSRTWRIINSSGTILASGSTSNEAVGVQSKIKATLSTPLNVTGGTQYEIVWFMPDGWIFARTNAFNSAVVNGKLTVPAGVVNDPINGNGRYAEAAQIQNPNLSWYNSDYYIDVTFRYVEIPAEPIPPVLLTPASISVPNGYVVGQQATATLATFDGADEVLAEWELNQNTYLPVAGNNPLTIPDNVGQRLGLWVRGVNENGTTASLVLGELIAAAPEEPDYTTEYGESLNLKVGTNSGPEGVDQTLATQFRFLKEGWVDGFRFRKHASDTTTSRAYRVWDYPSVGSTSGATLVSGTTSGEATGTEHVEEVLFSSPLVYDTVGDLIEIGYFCPNPGYTLAKTEEYNSDKTHGNVVTRGYGAGSNGPNGNSRYQANGTIIQPNASWYNSDYYIRPIFRSISGDPPDPPDPPLGDWPNASNTGVPAGVTLINSGGFSTTANGQVIENLRITGKVTIHHNNVEIRNCFFACAGVDYAIDMPSLNYSGAGKPGLWVHDCTFDGGYNCQTAAKARGLFQRCNIGYVENGLIITGISDSGHRNGCEIIDCYIHHIGHNLGGHFDGIELDGGSAWIEHNHIDLRPNTQTSCIMIDNYFYSIGAVRVHNNRLYGGGYNVYVDNHFSGGVIPNNAVNFTDNRFDYWINNVGALGTMTILQSNNVRDSNGVPVTIGGWN